MTRGRPPSTSRTVDRLVAEDPEGALADDDDQQGDHERQGRDQQRQRDAPNRLLMPSQPIVLIQLRRPGSDDRLAERQAAPPASGPCRSSGPSSPGARRSPNRARCRRRSPADEVAKPSLRKSSVTSVPMKNAAGTRFGVNQTVKSRVDRAVAGGLRDRVHAVGFDRQVALVRGHPFAANRSVAMIPPVSLNRVAGRRLASTRRRSRRWARDRERHLARGPGVVDRAARGLRLGHDPADDGRPSAPAVEAGWPPPHRCSRRRRSSQASPPSPLGTSAARAGLVVTIS